MTFMPTNLVSICSSAIMNLYENDTAEMLTFNLCCFEFYLMVLMDFSGETNNGFLQQVYQRASKL